MKQLLKQNYRSALPVLFILLFSFNGAVAQVGTGFFNGTVFSTYASVNAGALSGNNFAITYTGTYSTKVLAAYTPGNLPANTGFPGTNPPDLELMGSAANASTLYTFTSTLPQFSTIYLQDVDLNEIIRVEFFDAGNVLINTSNIIIRTISTAGLPAITTTATSVTATGLTTNVTEPLVAFTINTTTVKSVAITQLSGATGGTYEAFFGILRLDHGDAPATYGDAGHFPSTTLKLGALGSEAEAVAAFSATANGDDAATSATVIDDEDGVASFNALAANATSYSVSVTLANTTGANATLTGWIDFNRNGIFDAGEASAATVANGATSATVNWTGLSGLVSGQSFARFRIASNAAEVTNPTGFAVVGEVEDYPITISSIVPLSLLSFSGERSSNNIIVNWKSENEINVNHFEVEYSTDGVSFANGGSVAARNQAVNNYQFTLVNYTQPIYYIRLKSIDADSRFKYSAVITIRMNGGYTKAMTVTPNPVTDRVSVRITSDVATSVNIRIIDAVGQVLYQSKQQLVKGENVIYINSLSNAAQGMYLVQAIVDGEKLIQKIVISK